MNIKIKKMTEFAILPYKGTEGAAAYDLAVPTNVNVCYGRQTIPLGFAIELPKGYCAEIHPRSGFASKGMTDDGGNRRNADVIYGLIDSDYRGEVCVIVNNKSLPGFQISVGTRIAQMVIRRVEDVEFTEVDELSETERGEGGFGSTNKE
jgi:dUTP pyrophosphatase